MSVAQEYTLIIQWSDEDQLYLAYSPELPGCITHGRTYLEAAEMGVEAMELWCDVTLRTRSGITSRFRSWSLTSGGRWGYNEPTTGCYAGRSPR